MTKGYSIYCPRAGDLLVDPDGRRLIIGDVAEDGAELESLLPKDHPEFRSRRLPPGWDLRGNLVTDLRAALLREQHATGTIQTSDEPVLVLGGNDA